MSEQVEELTRGEALARVAVLEAKLAESHTREQGLEDQIKELESRKFIRFNEDECWAWQGDGSDNLETLVCPVVIRPADLLAMLAAAPAPVERNQCDGCQAGIPVESGMHRMGKPGGYADLMACTADRYGSAPVERVEQEPVGEIIQVDWRRFISMDDETLNSLPVGTKLYTTPQPAPTAAQDVAGLPFVGAVLEKLERFRECAEDDQGTDIGRHWLDVLTHLGLLNRVQRSPACWEMTAQADDALEAAHQSGGAK